MTEVSLEALLEAGCHFGHQVSRQNSKARDYIFGERDGIHIIDLEKTKEGLEDAAKFIKSVASRNGNLLVVGTKRQADAVLKEEKARLGIDSFSDPERGLYFVTKRWIGGTLTNFQEVSKNYRKLKDLKKRLKDDDEKAKYTKKEVGDWDKDRQKLESFYGGAADLTAVPDALFIIDTHLEHTAVDEARKMNVAAVGITDTNTDPTMVEYPIPANDDAVGSLKLIISYILDAWVEGRKEAASNAIKEKEAAEKAKVKAEKEAEVAAEKVAKAAAKVSAAAEKKSVRQVEDAPRSTQDEEKAPAKKTAKKAAPKA